MSSRTARPQLNDQHTIASRSSNPRKRPAPSDAQEEAWVAEEDQFVLRQAKRKAALRVRAKRSKPIDRLAVTLAAIDPTKNAPDDDDEDNSDLEIVDPEGLLESLDKRDLEDLRKDVDTYLQLEQHPSNKEYWQTMKMICEDRLNELNGSGPAARGIRSVSHDVDKILAPKTFDELLSLEKQIRRKLSSNEPIDVDYWEHLLKSLQSFKAKARLRKVSQSILNTRLDGLRKQQKSEAESAKLRLRPLVEAVRGTSKSPDTIATLRDPEPLLRITSEDKAHPIVDEREFLETVARDRQRVQKLGYVPLTRQIQDRPTAKISALTHQIAPGHLSRIPAGNDDETSEIANAQFHREVARGFWDNEEVFAAEESLASTTNSKEPAKGQLRKPKFFNRVQLGYEWNKYNQTHYDHDNPPPKVVQGYRFNIFYPNLIDKSKAPSYKIEREGGRKRGQTFAPAGENDTCVIRFIAGPPYQDVAFRIVDKEWDYSAKRERGFKSTFENGVLSLHFQFKKVFYRK